MSVLLLKLAGPLQSWGSSSRFNRRATQKEPTKSGVIGMLAAAQGRAREDSITDLLKLSFAVRADQPGTIVSDLQTEHSTAYQERNGVKLQMPLSHRYYISDAKFVVAIGSSDSELIGSLASALRTPKWPLFLGRRSCPPDFPIVLKLRPDTDSVRKALAEEPWHAAAWFRRKLTAPDAALEAVGDAEEGEGGYSQMDLPVTFNPQHREYETRSIHRWQIRVCDLPGQEEPMKSMKNSITDTAKEPVTEPPQFRDSNHDPLGA